MPWKRRKRQSGGGSYKSTLPEEIRWKNWASDEEGITGDELLDFVNKRVFGLIKELATENDGKARIVRQVFEDIHNYMKNGVLMRQVLNKINEIDFKSSEDRHLFNDIYEAILKELQSAGSSGEFYTPRAVTEFVTEMVNPKLGEKILDPACGTGGFLISSIEKMKGETKSVEDLRSIGDNVKGIEKKPFPHLLCMTNLILHDVEEPNVKHDNSLARPLRDYSSKDMVDCVVTNPPFGRAEEDGIEKNFPQEFQTRETADLFLVLIMKLLREEGRCGIVLPDGFMFGEGVKTRIKEKLLSEFNLHTIVRLPNSVFNPYTIIRTNLLFFEKGKPTKDIWYFEHKLPQGYKSYNKGKPIRIKEFDLEKEWWNDRENEKFKEHCWKVSKEEIEKRNYNLYMENPGKKAEEEIFSSEEILGKLGKSFDESGELIKKINALMSLGTVDRSNKQK